MPNDRCLWPNNSYPWPNHSYTWPNDSYLSPKHRYPWTNDKYPWPNDRYLWPNPVCAQWCMFPQCAQILENMTFVARLFRALHRAILSRFFKFFKTGKCFKTMLFPVSRVSQKPLAFQKHSLLLTHPKTHAKTLSERSEKCATLQVLIGNNSVARAKHLQRALWTLWRALYQV